MLKRGLAESYRNNMLWLTGIHPKLITCNLTFAVSRGNVIRSATQAAEPAVKSCTARPGVAPTIIGCLFAIGATIFFDVVVVVILLL